MGARRWILGLSIAAALSCPPAAGASVPYSSHSQLYTCCTDSATKEAMFLHAKESGAQFIRVDVAMESVFPQFGPSDGRDWEGLDEVAELSERYGLRVLAVLQGTPRQGASCPDEPWFEQRTCPPADPLEWGEQAGEVASRYAGRIDHFQIWNEPDGAWAFRGTPSDYARILSASYDSIKRTAPGATVVLGGMMQAHEPGRAWLEAVFSTPETGAAGKFDIAAIHLRGPVAGLTFELPAWREFLSRWAREVPMWVTEHGYPSASEWQRDPLFAGGEQAQAAYLSTSLPLLATSGADQVFVTLRDGGGGVFESEGIVEGKGMAGEAMRRKLAWHAVRQASLSWPPPPPPGVPAPLGPPSGPCARLQSGSNGRDLLRGTKGGDRLEGKGGSDRLDGLGADDCLRGAAGDDRLAGRLGKDELLSGTGDDHLNGGSGNDRLLADAGADRLSGDDGNDVLGGGSGRDVLDGGTGRDRIEAADGQRDTVRCGRGFDTVTADRADRLAGCERVRRKPDRRSDERRG